jgi:hypothetical protein
MQDDRPNPIEASAIVTAPATPEAAPDQQLTPPPTPLPAPVPQAPPPRPRRIPNFLDLLLFGLLLLGGLVCAIITIFVGVYFHLFGVTRIEDIMHSMAYAIGTMIVWYVISFPPAIVIFPALWHKKLLAGLQWNAAVPRRLWPWLMATGAACFFIAVAARAVLHFPDHSPIEGLLSTPQAVWIMFAFSISVAPLCEEIMFRGFMLPALSTAFDWTGEKLTHRPAPALLAGDHPRWSLPAMILASIFTSIAFALIHLSQIGNSLGPIVLIFSVSLVLCAVRLATRSLAASTLTHATYNCTLFVLMAIETHGFTHLHK